MKIEIVITGKKYLNKADSFGDSIIEIINQEYHPDRNNKIVKEYTEELGIIQKSNKDDDIENVVPQHLTLENEFALNLKLLDSIDCSCLKDITSVGTVLKEIMIDNYQLVLTRRHWSETNRLILFFDAVDYGNADEFISKAINSSN